MQNSPIPDDKQAAVNQALQSTFGTSTIDDIRALTGGHSGALVYRVIVQGTPYLLRLITRTNDSTLPDHIACLRTAAEAGLAPRLLFTSDEDKILITDFVDAVPFSASDALKKMPEVLRNLHALPAFPPRAAHLNTTCTFLLNQDTAMAFLDKFRASNALPPAVGEMFFVRLDQLVSAHSRVDADLVSSHNDLFKPDNILFDGKRVWLVDWEAAFLNDRYAELAVVANLLISGEAAERDFLERYLGQPPDEYQLARLFLMRQLTHLFYAMAFLWSGAAGNSVDWTEAAPDFDDVNRRFWTGELKLDDKPSKALYGRAHLHRALEQTSESRLREALQLVSEPPQ